MEQVRYDVVESKQWMHVSGATASIYGACPWTSADDKPQWRVVSRGWTIRDSLHNRVGLGRMPFPLREDAVALANKLNGGLNNV